MHTPQSRARTCRLACRPGRRGARGRAPERDSLRGYRPTLTHLLEMTLRCSSWRSKVAKAHRPP